VPRLHDSINESMFLWHVVSKPSLQPRVNYQWTGTSSVHLITQTACSSTDAIMQQHTSRLLTAHSDPQPLHTQQLTVYTLLAANKRANYRFRQSQLVHNLSPCVCIRVMLWDGRVVYTTHACHSVYTIVTAGFVQTLKHCSPGLTGLANTKLQGVSWTQKMHFQWLSRIGSWNIDAWSQKVNTPNHFLM